MRIALLLIVTLLARGQEFRATLTGRVTDPVAAPVAGAVVALLNVDTNERLQHKTDGQGNYSFALIRPGNYELRAEHSGFKTMVRRGIVLQVNQAATVDLSLTLGTVTETVTVTDEAPLLETASADRGGTIDQQFIKDMPLNGRNPFMLSMLVAGVNYNGSLAYMRPFDNGAIADFGINGGANRSNEFLMDGVPNNAQAGGNNIAYVPPVDSVQEFKIQTNSYDAQYGKTSGGIVNVVLKSGTNRWHGAAYEFARRNAWDANSFQNNARGAAKEGHFQDQYGLQMDGPLIKNRTFFLVNYEGYREASPQPLILSVPALEMRNGDFSKLVDARGRTITVHDASTGFVNPAFSNRWDRLPYPGNVIPPSQINPISRKILDFFPRPNTSTPSTNYSQSNYFISGAETAARDDFYNFVAKFDQNISDKHRMFFRHASNDRTETRSTNGILNSPGQDGQMPLKRINDAYVIDWVTTVSPSLLFNIRSSFSRYVEGSRGDANAGFDLTTLGFPKKLVDQMPYGPFFGRYTFANYMSLGRYPSNNITNTFTVHPTMTYIKGSRTIKFGVDMRRTQYSTQTYGNVFVLGATNTFSQRDYLRADASSGNSIASWLLGTPSSGSINYNVFPIFSFPYIAPWVQSDWKISRKLTVNVGLRQDYNVPPSERFDRLNRGFDTEVKSPLSAMIDRERFPDFPEIRGGLAFAGVGSTPRRAANLDWRTFQPRAGFAWSLTNKTVLRGGWGRFHSNPNNDYLQTTGFSLTTPLVFSTNESRSPVNNKINDPFPTGVLTPYGSDLGPLTYVGRAVSFVNPKFRIPAVNSFSIGLQHLLFKGAKLEVTYSGSRAQNLQNSKLYNEAEFGFRDQCSFLNGGNPAFCDQQLPNPFRGLAPLEGTTWYESANLSRAQLLRPYPQYAALTELMRNEGGSWYNSVQTSLTIRNKWTNLLANYTFSKNVERNGFLDPLRDVMQQGLASFDKPHRLVISAVTPIPLGRGTSGWRARLLKGWETSTIYSLQSGRPQPLPGNVLYVKEAKLPSNWDGARVQGWSPCVQRWNENNTITWMPYSLEAGCTEPNFVILPRFTARFTPFRDGRLRVQGSKMLDMSLNKTTQLNERFRVQFRAEVFNVTNSFFLVNAQFETDPENVNFGSIIKAATSAPNSNYPRQIQLAVKFLW
ncbi:MAG: carboxypeptidase regulatory-like domain-containing protein [Acidobacteria bacterium]|nr:carboxypeptidase regulatory-like domain-containing protein [Acidobacteriota bacterium]